MKQTVTSSILLPFERWESIIQALRNEIQEYGYFLNLIVEQQSYILECDTEKLLNITNSIDIQVGTLEKLCRQREQMLRLLNDELRLKVKATTLSELILHAPHKIQGLLIALTEEIKSLIEKVQRKTRQNHLLLLRAGSEAARVCDPGPRDAHASPLCGPLDRPVQGDSSIPTSQAASS